MNLLRKGLTDDLEPQRGLGFKLVIDCHFQNYLASDRQHYLACLLSEVRVAGQTLFDPRHSDQNQTDTPMVKDVAHLL